MQVVDAKQLFNILSTASADLAAYDAESPAIKVASDTLATRAKALADVIAIADSEKRDALTKAEDAAVVVRDPLDVAKYQAAMDAVRAAPPADLDDEHRLRLVNALVAVGAK